jgi:hypothetical protein
MTTAQTIADLFDNDGQKFLLPDDVELDDICDDNHSRREYRDGWGTDTYRHVFPDGSVLTVAGGAWDLGYRDCYCWQEAGHSDNCEALPRDEIGEVIA